MNTITKDITPQIQALQRGEKVIIGDAGLDLIQAFFPKVSEKIASLPNPNRVGILDQYVAWIKSPAERLSRA